MNEENAIYTYYQGIQDGSITVGKWIRMLYEVIIDGLESGRWTFDQRRANSAIGFIERYCHHYKGKLAPGRIKLSLWQKAALSLMFGIIDADGIRQFTECMFVVGRKCGKTLIAAGLETYFAYAAGEFGSEIYFLAPKLAQADLAFSALEFNVDHEPTLQKKTKSTKTRGLYIKESNTTIQKLPFADKTSDGYGPMSWVGDEGSSWVGDKGLKQWEVMVSGTGARDEPFGIMISSAGYVNEGIYDELFRRGTAFLMGNSQEEHILPILYTIDDQKKWDDLNELRKSLPGLGESVSVKFILKEIATARESLSKKTEFLTKYCNIKQSSSQAWFRSEDVQRMFGHLMRLEDLKNHYVLAGVDLSQSVDLTSACIACQKDDVIWIHSHFWLPRKRIEEATRRDGVPYQIMIDRGFLSPSGEEFIDTNDVLEWFKSLVRDYKIYPLQVGYDRYSAQEWVQLMEKASFHMESVFQGWNLTGIEDTFEGMLREGRIRDMDDNDLLKIHMMDAAQQIETGTSAHPRKKLVKLSKNAHVDGVAAILDAMCMRANHWAEMGRRLMNAG
ncbi:MAG: terminase large subunit [Clostridia bacterium]|nr:terminase large subunit [Clostridia bacterium]